MLGCVSCCNVGSCAKQRVALAAAAVYGYIGVQHLGGHVLTHVHKVQTGESKQARKDHLYSFKSHALTFQR